MLHTLKNIRQNSIFYDSKSATHETFVTGKVTFRICHDEFECHWRGQIAGILSRCLCHLFPTIITRKLRKLLKNLRQPCRSANFMYTGIRRHVSVAPQRAALQSSYTIENNTVDCAFNVEGCLLA